MWLPLSWAAEEASPLNAKPGELRLCFPTGCRRQCSALTRAGVAHHADVLTLKGASYHRRNRGIDTLPSI